MDHTSNILSKLCELGDVTITITKGYGRFLIAVDGFEYNASYNNIEEGILNSLPWLAQQIAIRDFKFKIKS